MIGPLCVCLGLLGQPAPADPPFHQLYLQSDDLDRSIRPLTNTDRDLLAGVLVRLRQPDLASQLQGSATGEAPTESTWETTVTTLIRTGELAIADRLLSAWSQQQREAPTATVFRAVLQHAMGENELAQRTLLAFGKDAPPKFHDMTTVLRHWVRYELAGGRVGIAGNPWGAKFVGPNNSFEPIKIVAAEKEKIGKQPGDAEELDLARVLTGLTQLLSISPRLGHGWALLGELCNADGDAELAKKCYMIATSMEYRDPVMRLHQRAVDAYLTEQKRQSIAAVNAKPTDVPAAPADAVPEIQASPFRFTVVIIIGVLAVVGIIGLQLREWIKR